MGILGMNHSSCYGIVKCYPKFLPMILLSALLCNNDPFYFFSSLASGKQRLTLFDPCIHSLDGVAMPSHLWRIMEPCDSSGQERAGWRKPQGDGVVLCRGIVHRVLL